MELINNKNSLGEGYLLHWYEIKKILGRGGFGITYLAHDNNLSRDVAIKEFMPEDFASRESNSTVHPKNAQQKELYDWGLQRFVDEARTLARFNHPNIVRVLSVFEENNTAYMVMEYAHGKDLSSVYKNARKDGQGMTEDELLDVFIPIMDGLALVHNAGFIHRDIKPANIYICDHNSPLLLDFGSARQSISGKTKALTSLVTYGYAPFEQYNEGAGKQGPWTDIYSLGASLYTGITGKKPVDAMARGGSFLDKGIDCYEPASIIAKGLYSDHFLLAVDRALMFKAEDRPENSLQCADMLLGKIPAPPLPENMLAFMDDDATIVRPRVNTGHNSGQSKPPLTAGTQSGTQGGTQGLVDSQGRRNSARTDNRINKNTANSYTNATMAAPASNNAVKLWVGLIVLALIALGLLISFGGLLDEVKDTKGAGNHVVQKMPSEKPARKVTQGKVDPQKNQISGLLESANLAFATGDYTKPAGESAYDYYQKILKLQKNNTKAKRGIKSIEKELLSLAGTAYFEKQYAPARGYLQQLNKVNPDSSRAKSLLQRISAEQNQQSNINAWLKKAQKQLKDNRYTSPKDSNAYMYFNKVLAIEPENKQAQNGIKKIQKFYIQLFEKHLSKRQLSKAERDLRIIKKIAVADSEVSSMQKRLNLKQKKYATKKTTGQKKQNTKQAKKLDIEQVSHKLSQFKSAIQTGNKDLLNKVSAYTSGRERFVNQLLVKYQSITVKISRLQLIGSKNIAKARVDLTDLIDVNSETVKAGAWGSFDITLRYNKNNELKVIW